MYGGNLGVGGRKGEANVDQNEVGKREGKDVEGLCACVKPRVRRG